jgi:hypothetical protein
MKSHCFLLAAPILLICACASVSDHPHLSPSGKYAITFYEAKGEADSYYQMVDHAHPEIRYASIGGATPLDDGDMIWSPTEKTCVILENRPGSVGLQNGTGQIRILYIVTLKEDSEYHMIYLRPFERHYFKEKKIKVFSVSDARVTFQVVNEQGTKDFSMEKLIEESHRQNAQNYHDHEILD